MKLAGEFESLIKNKNKDKNNYVNRVWKFKIFITPIRKKQLFGKMAVKDSPDGIANFWLSLAVLRIVYYFVFFFYSFLFCLV